MRELIITQELAEYWPGVRAGENINDSRQSWLDVSDTRLRYSCAHLHQGWSWTLLELGQEISISCVLNINVHSIS